MKRIGLGYDELKKIKPDIIMVSSGTMGQTGPYAILPDFGGHLSALFSFNYIIGWTDREPANVRYYTDFITPHFNA